MQIRAATAQDCLTISTLWNTVIQGTDITFNSIPKTVRMLQDDLEQKARQNHPFLLAMGDDAVLGFATYGRFRASDGYDETVEHTIILARKAQGQGIGRTLMQGLETHAKAAGLHAMIAGLSAGNQPAIDFHTVLGFTKVGHLPEVGKKLGRRLDLVLMQKIL